MNLEQTKNRNSCQIVLMDWKKFVDSLDSIFSKLGKNINSVFEKSRLTSVECINYNFHVIKPLEPFKPVCDFSDKQHLLLFYLAGCFVLFTDHSMLSFGFKLFLISSLLLGYLVYNDYANQPIVYRLPASKKAAHNVTFADELSVNLLQCVFAITSVKIMDDSKLPSTESRALFNIVTTCGDKRWVSWKKYEDCYDIYLQLCQKHDQELIHAKLQSFKKAKKYYRKLTTQGLGAIALDSNNEQTMTSTPPIKTSATDTSTTTATATIAEDHKEYLELPFLQYLQSEILAWLQNIQRDMIVNDDDLVKKLLNVPTQESEESLLLGTSGGSNNHNTKLKSNLKSVSKYHSSTDPISASTATTTSTNDSNSKATATSLTMSSSPFILKRAASAPINTMNRLATASNSNDHSTNLRSMTTDNFDTTLLNNTHDNYFNSNNNSNGNNSNSSSNNDISLVSQEVNEEYIAPDGTWKGNNIYNFQFLDVTEESKQYYKDCSYTHNFRVRGLNYMDDKKKVDAGPSVAKFILLEVYKVDSNKYGNRIDHIARIGRVKRRTEILASLPDKPFVFLFNLQLPGDPPVNVVTYFAVPRNGSNSIYHNEEYRKVRGLFERFIDIPLSQEDIYGRSDNEYDELMRAHSNSNSNDNNDSIQGQSPNNSNKSIITKSQNNNNDKSRDSSISKLNSNSTDIGTDFDEDDDDDDGYATPTNDDDDDVITKVKRKSSLASPKTPPTTTDQTTLPTKKVEFSDNSSGNNSNDNSKAQQQSTSNNSYNHSSNIDDNKLKFKNSFNESIFPSSNNSNNNNSGWSVASDITWPEVGEPGVLERKSFQNLRFKLIPTMVEAPWIVQMAVSSTPVILGQKVSQRYFRGENYLEIDVHVGSSTVASRIVALCRSYTKQYVCNLGIVLQGENEGELPEKLFASVTLNKLDVDVRATLE